MYNLNMWQYTGHFVRNKQVGLYFYYSVKCRYLKRILAEAKMEIVSSMYLQLVLISVILQDML